MADNDTKPVDGQTTLASAVNMEELRAIIRQIISDEIAGGLVPLVHRVDELALDMSDAKKSLERAHEKVKTLDELYRTANNTYIDVVASNNKVLGALTELQRTLDKWAANSSDNSKAIVELKEDLDTVRRELYGDPKALHDRSIMGELSKMPALIASAIKTEVQPLVTRIDKIQTTVEEHTRFVNGRKKIEGWARSRGSTGKSILQLILSPIVLKFAGAGAVGAVIAEILKLLGGG